MVVHDKAYSVIKLLGKGKGGYPYLAADDWRQYVLKQIHHEPCDYYTTKSPILWYIRHVFRFPASAGEKNG